MSEQRRLRRIKQQHKDALMARPNIVGVGIGHKVIGGQRTTDLCITVMVRRKLALETLPPGALIPRALDGVQTDVVQVGDVRALQARTDRWRPAPGGVSIGHHLVTAGTLGCVVRDRETGVRLILSNNHVLANSNDATPGDPILQPGAADGGTISDDVIAELERFQEIEFATLPGDCPIADAFAGLGNIAAILLGSGHRLSVSQEDPIAMNLVDAAVARAADDDISDEILEIGVVEGVLDAALGMPVRKSGRTTELNEGEITVLDTTIAVSYGGLNVAVFEGQITTSAMAQGGDSGSLLVSADAPQAVGLLFAGSDQVAIHNPIQSVLELLDVEIGAD